MKLGSVTLDIEKGDILLGGRFKNSPITVDEIGEDENGQPTINGRKLLAYRIKKKMQDKTAEEYETKKKQKPEREHLPYRIRVEVVAYGPNDTVLGGKFDDGTFGMYGGGVDAEDDSLLAGATREFEEESGYVINHLAKCKVDPVIEEWVELPDDASAKFKERFPKFRGSKTIFFRGDLSDAEKGSKSKEDSKTAFKQIKLYPVDEALDMLAPEKTKKGNAPSACAGRRAAIEEAHKMHNFTKESMLAKLAMLQVDQLMEKISYIRVEGGKHYVFSEKGKKLSKGYDSAEEAQKRLGQIEYFKNKGKKADALLPSLGAPAEPEKPAGIAAILPPNSRFKLLLDKFRNLFKRKPKPVEEPMVVNAALKEDKIPGGLSDGVPDSKFDKKELAQGMEEETEHTSDPSIAKEIAKDHLTEDTKYYDKLKRMMERRTE